MSQSLDIRQENVRFRTEKLPVNGRVPRQDIKFTSASFAGRSWPFGRATQGLVTYRATGFYCPLVQLAPQFRLAETQPAGAGGGSHLRVPPGPQRLCTSKALHGAPPHVRYVHDAKP
jgi:hypothetical protein